jgi:hypothetical protein
VIGWSLLLGFGMSRVRIQQLMSPRIPALLLVSIAALCMPVSTRAQTTQATSEPVWEYRVLTLDPTHCVSAEAMTTVLNTNGRQGWELVGFQAEPPQFPSTVDGAVALRAGAPNGRNDLYPQLADTVQGSVSLKMPQIQPGACHLIFKRKASMTHP